VVKKAPPARGTGLTGTAVLIGAPSVKACVDLHFALTALQLGVLRDNLVFELRKAQSICYWEYALRVARPNALNSSR
jgi:hypothetical protein